MSSWQLDQMARFNPDGSDMRCDLIEPYCRECGDDCGGYDAETGLCDSCAEEWREEDSEEGD